MLIIYPCCRRRNRTRPAGCDAATCIVRLLSRITCARPPPEWHLASHCANAEHQYSCVEGVSKAERRSCEFDWSRSGGERQTQNAASKVGSGDAGEDEEGGAMQSDACSCRTSETLPPAFPRGSCRRLLTLRKIIHHALIEVIEWSGAARTEHILVTLLLQTRQDTITKQSHHEHMKTT
jgi:hypothetical protein